MGGVPILQLVELFASTGGGQIALGQFAVDGIKQIVALARKPPTDPDGRPLTPEMVAARFDQAAAVAEAIGDDAERELAALQAARPITAGELLSSSGDSGAASQPAGAGSEGAETTQPASQAAPGAANDGSGQGPGQADAPAAPGGA